MSITDVFACLPPPFLLPDRVLSLSGSTNVGEGYIVTETDLNENKWYLHNGYIPLSIMIEACHGNLLLISWLGYDFSHKGEKIYRMLGGKFKLSGECPRIGDTLKYEVHVYKSPKTNLIVIDSDCYVNGELRLTIRNSGGGFFSEEQLNSSKGILWDPKKVKYQPKFPLAPPLVQCQRAQFSKQNIEVFAKGDLYACFGRGYESAQGHKQSPCIQSGSMQLLDEIQLIDPQGGPWQRGYMRAVQRISPEDWFFQCHFKNDPVMPGVLSIEAFLQTMSFYLAALGYSLDKDGWRFEALRDREYDFVVRGQVTPATQAVIYEVFVEELIINPFPTLIATVLATTLEGVSINQIKHFAIHLIPNS